MRVPLHNISSVVHYIDADGSNMVVFDSCNAHSQNHAFIVVRTQDAVRCPYARVRRALSVCMGEVCLQPSLHVNPMMHTPCRSIDYSVESPSVEETVLQRHFLHLIVFVLGGSNRPLTARARGLCHAQSQDGSSRGQPALDSVRQR